MRYEDMKEAVMAYYADTSRSRPEVKRGLETLQVEIDLLVRSLEDRAEWGLSALGSLEDPPRKV